MNPRDAERISDQPEIHNDGAGISEQQFDDYLQQSGLAEKLLGDDEPPSAPSERHALNGDQPSIPPSPEYDPPEQLQLPLSESARDTVGNDADMASGLSQFLKENADSGSTPADTPATSQEARPDLAGGDSARVRLRTSNSKPDPPAATW